MKLQQEPGKQFEYLSGNTQLLGLALERALKEKTITSYLEEKIWKPLEMEFDASRSFHRRKNNGHQNKEGGCFHGIKEMGFI